MTDSPIGFPAQRNQARFLSMMQALRARGETTRTEAVTGRLEDPAKARRGAVADLLGVERALADLEQSQQIIALAQGRSTVAQASFDALRTTADELMTQTQINLQGGNESLRGIIAGLAEEALGAAVGRLNVSFAGRAVFAGDAGDGAALAPAADFIAEATAILEAAPTAGAGMADLELAFDTPGGVFETALYQGGTGDAPEVDLGQGERVAYHARADEQPFRDLLRNIAALAAAFDESNTIPDDAREGIAERALEGLRNTTAPLNAISARIGTAEQRIEAVRTRNIATETVLATSYNDLAGRDTLEAAVEMQSIEGQLETLFLTTARFSQLSLANFIR